MSCGEMDRLNEQRRKCLDHFQRLVGQLSDVIGNHKAFDHHWRECDNARQECIGRREEIDAHVAEHGCQAKVTTRTPDTANQPAINRSSDSAASRANRTISNLST